MTPGNELMDPCALSASRVAGLAQQLVPSFHPRERVDWACGTALDSRCFTYRVVRRLVHDAAERATTPALRSRIRQVQRDCGPYIRVGSDDSEHAAL